MQKEWEELILMLDKYSALGERVMPNGARLIGHVPHVAPLAYLHTIYPPLNLEELCQVEKTIGRKIGNSLADFYKITNGVKLFSGELTIDGLRTDNSRSIESSLSQPFDIGTVNVDERPAFAEDDMIFIGGYKDDGSLLYMRYGGNDVFRCSQTSKAPLNHWTSIVDLLLSESKRFVDLFDESGKLFDEEKSTVPPVSP